MGTRCANHVTPLYPQKLALTSPTGGGRSVGMVRSRTKATEFSLVLIYRVGEKSPYTDQYASIILFESLTYALLTNVLCDIRRSIFGVAFSAVKYFSIIWMIRFDIN